MEIGNGSRPPPTVRSAPRENRVEQPTQPAVQDTPPAETTQNTPTETFQDDRFEATPTQPGDVERLAGETPPAAQGAGNAPGTNSMSSSSAPSDATAAQAQEILDMGRNNVQAATHALGESLRAPDSTQEQREALVTELLEQDPYTSAQILNEAGERPDVHSQVTEEDRRIISETLGQAWERANPAGQAAPAGTEDRLDSADLRAVLSPNNTNTHAEFGAQAHNLGNVIGASGSASLQQTAATQLYDIGREFAAGNEVDGNPAQDGFQDAMASSYMAGSALAASGSPEAAQALMEHVASTGSVQDFVTRTSPASLASTHGPDAENALGGLMQAVGDQEATPAADKFFDEAAYEASNYVGEGSRDIRAEPAVQELQQGLAQYFQTNLEHTTERWATAQTIDGRASSVAFTSNVLFGDPFEGQEQLRQGLAEHMGQRAGALQNVPPGSTEHEVEAARLGSLIGIAEVGFQRALGRARETNAAREAMADFVVDMATAAGGAALGGKLPNLEFGPLNLQNAITGGIKEQLHEWVREEEPDAIELTGPLYEMGLSIEESYHDEMHSLRTSFSTDQVQGYLKRRKEE